MPVGKPLVLDLLGGELPDGLALLIALAFLTYVSAVCDLPDTTVERVDERSVRVAGSMTIDDVNEALGAALDTSYARTRAGLVLDELGRRPREGDEVQLGDVRLQVEQLDGRRITRLLVRTDGRITQNA